MIEHPTPRQLSRFHHHDLGAWDVRAIDAHLELCEECRSSPHAALAQVSLLSSLLPEDEHLPFDEVEAVARGASNAHVLSCESCAREVADLRAFARPGRWRFILAAAAVVVLASAVLFGLHARQRARELRLAQVAIPAEVLAMRGERLQLRGVAEEAALSVVEPVGTAVVADRPVFRWNAPEGEAVRVEVFDQSFRPVAQSEALTAHVWSPPRPLPRDEVYVWQVVTLDRHLAPAPPLPDARFRIVSADAARRIEAVRDDEPSLEVASLYAGAGALDDAQRELQRLVSAGKENIAVRRLLDRVENLR